MNQSAVPDSITGGADDENDDFNFDFGMPLDDFGDLVEMLGDGGTFEEPGRSIHQQPVSHLLSLIIGSIFAGKIDC